ncbi:MAG: FtsQ-type POTRA domain-containing protein [Ignavibacteria bacterium]|nr:FtsQ-type POTRA domain-containing protein [Ignavibacteria bacterium]
MSTRRTLKFGFVALLILLVGLVVSSNLWKSSLQVRHIVIQGNRIVETAEVLRLVRMQKNAQLHDVDLMGVRKAVLSHHFIKDAVVERDLPATLKITVTERAPLAIVNGAEILYLDEEGIVLPHSISKQLFDLPVLTGVSPDVALAAGTMIHNADVQEALAILATSKLVGKELYHMISEARLRNGGDIVLYGAERGVPIIFGRGNIADKLVRLEAFWNDVVREQGSDKLQYVDLRFDDQVVVRWNQKRG